jgi:hypothetical protein
MACRHKADDAGASMMSKKSDGGLNVQHTDDWFRSRLRPRTLAGQKPRNGAGDGRPPATASGASASPAVPLKFCWPRHWCWSAVPLTPTPGIHTIAATMATAVRYHATNWSRPETASCGAVSCCSTTRRSRRRRISSAMSAPKSRKAVRSCPTCRCARSSSRRPDGFQVPGELGRPHEPAIIGVRLSRICVKMRGAFPAARMPEGKSN